MFLTEQPKKRAVAYYRHSAEDKQENSVAIQRSHTQKFAKENQIEIIHEEADEGKSGLSAQRPAFNRLFENLIINPKAPMFQYVFVYDVSRWGRFQNQDESAFWEFLCQKHGKEVIYVSRGFPKEENALISHLQTSIERYMAAEYSRQLSEKVFYGCVKVSEQGYSAGGKAPYGMVRILLDESKQPIGILRPGEHKVISNQRVTFAPANDKTTEAVKTIFTLFLEERLTIQKIADILNDQRITTPKGGSWNSQKIIRILANETYIGSRIYNKTWKRLKQKQRHNPRNEWIICENAFEPIIDKENFIEAKAKLESISSARLRRGTYIKKQFEEELREFLKSHLKISENQFSYILKHFPLIFSTRYHNGANSRWCFTIHEYMKQHQYVIAASIEVSQNTIDRFFLIPIKNFGVGNFFILSERQSNFRKYLIEPGSLKNKILDVYQKFS